LPHPADRHVSHTASQLPENLSFHPSKAAERNRPRTRIDRGLLPQVRCLSADMVQAANSGHPGAPMGCAPMAHVLYGKQMAFSPSDPEW
jgi:hypothetical protein